MARQNSSTDLVLSKRWPRKFLQFFPASWKQRYLLRKSGGEAVGETFDLVRPF